MTPKLTPIRDLIDEISMGPFGSDIKVDNFIETGVPVLNGSNLTGVKLREESFKYVSKEKAKSLKKANAVAGDIVITHRGTLGQISYIPAESKHEKYVISQSQFRVRFKTNEIDPVYITYYFHTREGQKRLLANKSYVGVPALAQATTNFRRIEVPLPTLPTQKKIAKVLSTLDAKIELNNRINAELEAMAKLLYDYWFVQFDFPMTAAQATALGQEQLAGQPYKTSGGKMVFNATLKREIPEGWEDGTLDKLGEVIGGSTPSKANDDYFCTAGIPWITPKDLSDNKRKKFIQRGGYDVSEEGKKAASLKVMPAGTVLLSSRAPIGYTAIASNPLTTNQGFKSFVPNRGFGTDYVYRTLNHFMKLIEQNASGSTFKEISGGTLKAIKIPFPNSELEKEYAKKVGPISSQQQNLEKQNQELTQLRDWLLTMLMNGQVTVKD